MPRTPRYWSPKEDEVLRNEVTSYLNQGNMVDWCQISAKLSDRTNKDCRKRWHNAVAGGLHKGPWTKDEDEQLRSGVAKFGQRWTQVAKTVGSRSPDQCAKRWHQSLDPELDHSVWTAEESQTLLDAVEKLGRGWCQIQRQHFRNRSKNAIKNHYTILARKLKKSGSSGTVSSIADEPQHHGDGISMMVDNSEDEDDDNSSDDYDNQKSGSGSENTLIEASHSLKSITSSDASLCGVGNSEGASDIFPLPWDPDLSTWSLNTANFTELNFLDLPLNDLSGCMDAAPGLLDVGDLDIMQDTAPAEETGVDSVNLQVGSRELEEGNTIINASGNMVQFTMTMIKPSMDTIQSLTRIALENQANFRIERT